MAENKMDELKAKAFEVMDNADDINNQDEVLAAMFSAGIPFGKLKTLYRIVGIESGLIADPAVVKEEIGTFLEENDSDLASIEEWSEVESLIGTIASEVNGATEATALRLLRAYCKENEYDLPKKTTGKGGPRKRGGALAEAVTGYFNSTDEPTSKGFYDAILPAVKGPKNAVYYVGAFFTMCFAVKKGVTLDDANKAFKAMPVLNLKDLEAA